MRADYPETVSGVITRAVGTISQILESVFACLSPGGRMIFMKGPECDPEIEEAGQTTTKLFQLAADHGYRIPGTPHQRRLVIYERLATEAPVSARGLATSPGFDRPWRTVERVEPDLPDLSRPPDRPGGPQARPGAHCRSTDHRRGPQPVP